MIDDMTARRFMENRMSRSEEAAAWAASLSYAS